MWRNATNAPGETKFKLQTFVWLQKLYIPENYLIFFKFKGLHSAKPNSNLTCVFLWHIYISYTSCMCATFVEIMIGKWRSILLWGIKINHWTRTKFEFDLYFLVNNLHNLECENWEFLIFLKYKRRNCKKSLEWN